LLRETAQQPQCLIDLLFDRLTRFRRRNDPPNLTEPRFQRGPVQFEGAVEYSLWDGARAGAHVKRLHQSVGILAVRPSKLELRERAFDLVRLKVQEVRAHERVCLRECTCFEGKPDCAEIFAGEANDTDGCPFESF
jgi:hypothetical protein